MPPNPYRDTLNLPRTEFAMRGNLAVREPERLEKWQELDLYARLREARAGRERFLLHDGPPYANGALHMGHAVNKTLKDIIVRARNLDGFDAPYRPGWDCHGLPIELQVEKNLSREQRADGRAFRAACREYATEQIDLQREEFIRMGVLGQWDDPYLTMAPATEAGIVRALGQLLEKGYLTRGTKPVYWCADCHSALAEAEVEYEPYTSPAIDVRFDAADGALAEHFGLSADTAISVVIWTTTPWTLLANEAVCLHPELKYTLTQHDGRHLVIAADLQESFAARTGAQAASNATVTGAQLSGVMLHHPFLDKTVPVIVGTHVTAEDGTGCVHTAPAHGPDDHAIGLKFDLPVHCPVDVDGHFLHDTPIVGDLPTKDANTRILETLQTSGHLLAHEAYEHSYPHCWRHHTPLLFRSAPQWFIDMKTHELRDQALEATMHVTWHPDWGRERIRGMVEGRPDWCISRQRNWGVPIAVFTHRDDGRLHPDSPALIERVAERIEEDGIDAWSDLDPAELLGDDANEWVKSSDTLDVWFDSGVTHRTVLTPEYGDGIQAELYLEGSDQHRGWFQSSLLTSVALNDGAAPYTGVLTHGFVVDAKGHKMSKSRGNVILPQKVIDKMGADVLRLWVASTDTSGEMAVSDEILSHTSEAYRRIRNTARYLLSSLHDFDPATHTVPPEDMVALDQWMLRRITEEDESIRGNYQRYQFHRVIQRLHNFCVTELGSLYLDVTKDRTYTLPDTHPARRSAQTVMYVLAEALSRWLAPACPFTADEIYEHIPGPREDSVHLCEWFDLSPWQCDVPVISDKEWAILLEVRDRVNEKLEQLRQDDKIGAGLDADVKLTTDTNTGTMLNKLGHELHFLFICSSAEVDAAADNKETDIQVRASEHPKCTRCWHHCESVSTIDGHPELCSRCHNNVEGNGEQRFYV